MWKAFPVSHNSTKQCYDDVHIVQCSISKTECVKPEPLRSKVQPRHGYVFCNSMQKSFRVIVVSLNTCNNCAIYVHVTAISMKVLFVSVISLGLACLCSADLYMHNPRGSNNRLNEQTAQRSDGNRMFDSQV